MSRSVSAPSSVTKTSPCWNGFIVPGSTFRYGSSFCMVTRSPRSFSNRPRLDAVSPLPRLDATPPVTKTYLVEIDLDTSGGAAKMELPWSVRWRAACLRRPCVPKTTLASTTPALCFPRATRITGDGHSPSQRHNHAANACCRAEWASSARAVRTRQRAGPFLCPARDRGRLGLAELGQGDRADHGERESRGRKADEAVACRVAKENHADDGRQHRLGEDGGRGRHRDIPVLKRRRVEQEGDHSGGRKRVAGRVTDQVGRREAHEDAGRDAHDAVTEPGDHAERKRPVPPGQARSGDAHQPDDPASDDQAEPELITYSSGTRRARR